MSRENLEEGRARAGVALFQSAPGSMSRENALFRAFCGGRGAVSIRSRLDEPGERPNYVEPFAGSLFQSAPGSMSRENPRLG